jgi:hypothetical protein
VNATLDVIVGRAFAWSNIDHGPAPHLGRRLLVVQPGSSMACTDNVNLNGGVQVHVQVNVNGLGCR